MTHTAVFVGKVYAIRFRCYSHRTNYHHYITGEREITYSSPPSISTSRQHVGEEKFFTCQFDNPPIEKGEKVYIDSLDLTVTVTERMRSTNGGYVYHVNHVVSTIEDKYSHSTKTQAEEQLKVETAIYEKYKEEKAERARKRKEAPKKKWYHFFR